MRSFFSLIFHLTLFSWPTTALCIDMDGDGMSDVWQALWGVPSEDASLDYDSDGHDNLEEAFWRTDPWCASDKMELSLGAGESSVELSVESYTYRPFTIVRGSDLSAWRRLGSVFGNGEHLCIADYLDGNRAFYKIAAVTIPDIDQDGLDAEEEMCLGSSDREVDTDSDGLSDAQEFTLGTRPDRPDSDFDGIDDGVEHLAGSSSDSSDSDGDRLPDWWEITYGYDPLTPTALSPTDDTDGDGLSDIVEGRQVRTNPNNPDTDSDGIGDYTEWILRINPTTASTDSDGRHDSTWHTSLRSKYISYSDEGHVIEQPAPPEYWQQLSPNLLSLPSARATWRLWDVQPDGSGHWQKVVETGEYRFLIPGGVPADLRWVESYTSEFNNGGEHRTLTNTSRLMSWSGTATQTPVYELHAPEPDPPTDFIGSTRGDAHINYVVKVLLSAGAHIPSDVVTQDETFVVPSDVSAVYLGAVGTLSGHSWEVTSGTIVPQGSPTFPHGNTGRQAYGFRGTFGEPYGYTQHNAKLTPDFTQPVVVNLKHYSGHSLWTGTLVPFGVTDCRLKNGEGEQFSKLASSSQRYADFIVSPKSDGFILEIDHQLETQMRPHLRWYVDGEEANHSVVSRGDEVPLGDEFGERMVTLEINGICLWSRAVRVYPLKVVDAAELEVDGLRVSKMQWSLSASREGSPSLTIDHDDDRFYLKVEGGADLGVARVAIGTRREDTDATLDNLTDVTLTPVRGDLISDSLLLVAFGPDDEFSGSGIGADDQLDDRTHRAELGGEVVISARVDSPSPIMAVEVPARMVVEVNVMNMFEPSFPEDLQLAMEWEAVDEQIAFAKQAFAPIGIRLEVTRATAGVPPGVSALEGVTTPDPKIGSDDPEDETSLMDAFGTASTEDITVFFVHHFKGTFKDYLSGIPETEDLPPSAYARYPAWRTQHTNNVIMNPRRIIRPHIMAHEIGHVLTNRGHTIGTIEGDNGTEKIVRFYGLQKFYDPRYNLMAAGDTVPPELKPPGLITSKRMTEEQEDLILSNPYFVNRKL